LKKLNRFLFFQEQKEIKHHQLLLLLRIHPFLKLMLILLMDLAQSLMHDNLLHLLLHVHHQVKNYLQLLHQQLPYN
jgi:hypothetical protein|tara:strand:- start:10 stop:237 length:228 start_codon:yes stop_codon:yes gene_type:complete